MIRNVILGILLSAILSGCERSLKDNLINKIDQDCGINTKPGCIIVLKDVTKFTWDKVYFFGSWTQADSISRVIGFNYYDDVPDDNTRMLFTYGRKVVYEEDFESLDYYTSSIDFEWTTDNRDKEMPYKLKVSDAVFKVEKEKPKGSCKDCFEYNLLLTGK